MSGQAFTVQELRDALRRAERMQKKISRRVDKRARRARNARARLAVVKERAANAETAFLAHLDNPCATWEVVINVDGKFSSSYPLAKDEYAKRWMHAEIRLQHPDADVLQQLVDIVAQCVTEDSDVAIPSEFSDVIEKASGYALIDATKYYDKYPHCRTDPDVPMANIFRVKVADKTNSKVHAYFLEPLADRIPEFKVTIPYDPSAFEKFYTALGNERVDGIVTESASKA